MTTLFDSEFKVMEIVWQHAPITAKDISVIAASTIGWNKNTTYTVLKKLVEKGVIERQEPHFVCVATVTREQVRQTEARSLLDRLFGGSKAALFSSLLEDEELTQDELDELTALLKEKTSS